MDRERQPPPPDRRAQRISRLERHVGLLELALAYAIHEGRPTARIGLFLDRNRQKLEDLRSNPPA